MDGAYQPVRDGWKLDRMRHQDKKLDRKLRGVGSRAKQFAVVRERTASMAMEMSKEVGIARIPNSEALPRTFFARCTDETLKRINEMKKGSSSEFLMAMLDAYDQKGKAPEAALPASPYTFVFAEPVYKRMQLLAATRQKNLHSFLEMLLDTWEAKEKDGYLLHKSSMDKLKETQTRLGFVNVDQAVERMIELAEASQKRAVRVRELEEQLTKANQAIGQASLAAQIVTFPPITAPATEKAQELLFEFVDAATGMTATADASGEIIVAIASEKLVSMFGLWQKSVKLLGILKKAT